jgi:DNA-binding HxlR family transcriptional regulator
MNIDCTVYRTVEYLSKRWSLLILLELFKGEDYSKRYSELKNDLLDITPKVLSTRLKELQSEGLVSKTVDASSFPVRSDYTLTESGLALIDVIKSLKEWALIWKIDNEPCQKMDCADCPL